MTDDGWVAVEVVAVADGFLSVMLPFCCHILSLGGREMLVGTACFSRLVRFLKQCWRLAGVG